MGKGLTQSQPALPGGQQCPWPHIPLCIILQSLFSASPKLCLLPTLQLTTPFRVEGAASHPTLSSSSGASPTASLRSRVSPLSPFGASTCKGALCCRAGPAQPGRDRRKGEYVPSACPASPQSAARRGGTGPPARGVLTCQAPNSFQGSSVLGKSSGCCQAPAPLPGAAAGAARGAGPGPLEQHLRWDGEGAGSPASVQEAVPSQRARPRWGAGKGLGQSCPSHW